MDSFYGVPRRPPPPPVINAIQRVPAVPEVSLIENSFFAAPKNFNSCGYRAPLAHDNCGESLLKKHVRFKSPCLEMNSGKENAPQTLKSGPNLSGKTFKQIYMANVPDRHLDLSIFEPPSYGKTIEREFIPNSNKQPDINLDNRCVIVSNETKNLKSIENVQMPVWRRPLSAEISTQTEKCTEIVTQNDEPTIKDLYRIIQQQNEQIMMLQRQVNNLKTNIRRPEIEPSPCDIPVDRPLTTSPTKKGLFSFDVKTTSFEFSFRPQQKPRRQNDFIEPKIQEIIERDVNDHQNSLHLEDLEDSEDKNSYVSDVQSIEIKMDEYHSSDNEDDDSEVNMGLTFYKDLMEQVNNVLKKVRKQSECQLPPSRKPELTGQSMKAVKQATLQHLKNIGVNLSPIQESSEVSKQSELDINNPSEISCAVQQLLMKYLPQDKLVKAIQKSPQRKTKERKYITPPPGELSFATLQYMKKYNIIDGNKKLQEKKMEISPKILDVTALKMQPKLL